MLSGPLTVLGGIHTFNVPTAGRTITLMTDSTWNLAAGSVLLFNHVLAGTRSLTKTGEGALLITGDQLHTGETAVGNGVFGVGNGPASLAGDLSFAAGARLRFSPSHTLSVAGAVSFEDTFGVASLDGLDGNAALGTYMLIAGAVPADAITDAGPAASAPIGGGKRAYLTADGAGLVLTVVEEPWGPGPPVLAWAGFDQGHPVLLIDGPAGASYTVSRSIDLAHWSDAATLVIPELPFWWTDPDPLSGAGRFYLIRMDAR